MRIIGQTVRGFKNKVPRWKGGHKEINVNRIHPCAFSTHLFPSYFLRQWMVFNLGVTFDHEVWSSEWEQSLEGLFGKVTDVLTHHGKSLLKSSEVLLFWVRSNKLIGQFCHDITLVRMSSDSNTQGYFVLQKLRFTVVAV